MRLGFSLRTAIDRQAALILPFLRPRERRRSPFTDQAKSDKMKRDGLCHSIVCGAILLAGTAVAQADDAALPAATPQVITSGSNNVSVGGQDAARKGDTTDASEAVSEGSSNVFINGKPAVRVGDRTNCGGIVVAGAANVYVNGKPMARSGDLTAGCPGK